MSRSTWQSRCPSHGWMRGCSLAVCAAFDAA
jgi:hypothetical protein